MLTSENLRKLQYCFNELNCINSELLSMKVVDHFLEVVENESDIVIRGNTEGLVYLASTILELALSRIDNKHYHFDETGIIDKCDKELIVTYKKADWE